MKTSRPLSSPGVILIYMIEVALLAKSPFLSLPNPKSYKLAPPFTTLGCKPGNLLAFIYSSDLYIGDLCSFKSEFKTDLLRFLKVLWASCSIWTELFLITLNFGLLISFGLITDTLPPLPLLYLCKRASLPF